MVVSASNNFPAARQALKDAQRGIYAADVWSEVDFGSCSFCSENANLLAAKQWLASAFQGHQIITETAVVTTCADKGKLPLAACTAVVPIVHCGNSLLECKMTAERRGRGAGGAKSKDKTEFPYLEKKGPDSWRIKASHSHSCKGLLMPYTSFSLY